MLLVLFLSSPLNIIYKMIPKIFIMNKLYIIFFLLIFSNCKNETPQYSKSTTPLFDLKGFLDNEIAMHLKDIKKVKKTVTVNGKTETKEVAIKDWKEELKPFFNSDINRPAWKDKYQFNKKIFDTVGYAHTFTRITDNLKTKNMSIHFLNQNEVLSLSVENEQVGGVVNSGEAMQYFSKSDGQRSKIYSIKTKQKMLLSDEQNIEIQVELLNP
jgi:hypothetical protein